MSLLPAYHVPPQLASSCICASFMDWLLDGAIPETISDQHVCIWYFQIQKGCGALLSQLYVYWPGYVVG